jgi:hypothetical protein
MPPRSPLPAASRNRGQASWTIASRASFHFGIHDTHTLIGSGQMRKKMLSRVIRSFRPQTEHERGETASQFALEGSATTEPRIDLDETQRHRDHDEREREQHTDAGELNHG